MEDILDLEPTETQPGKLFSILSFIFAILTIAIPFGGYWIKDIFRQLLSIFHFSYEPHLITLFIGLIFSAFSIVRNERIKFIKPIGIGLNIIMLIFTISIVIYSTLFPLQFR